MLVYSPAPARPSRASYYDPASYDDYAYVQRQQHLARQAEIEAAYRRQLAAEAYRRRAEEEALLERQRAALAQRERERQRVMAEQRYAQQVAEARQRQARYHAQQQQHPFFSFLQQAAPIQQSHACVARPRPVYSRAQQEQAALSLQRKWRRHLLSKKASLHMGGIWSSLTALKERFTFPSEPDFDGEGKLLYNAHNAPIHAYVDGLEKLLIKLDAVESHGLDSVKQARKRLVKTINEELAKVDEWKASAWKSKSESKSAEPLALASGEQKVGFVVPITDGKEEQVSVAIEVPITTQVSPDEQVQVVPFHPEVAPASSDAPASDVLDRAAEAQDISTESAADLGESIQADQPSTEDTSVEAPSSTKSLPSEEPAADTSAPIDGEQSTNADEVGTSSAPFPPAAAAHEDVLTASYTANEEQTEEAVSLSAEQAEQESDADTVRSLDSEDASDLASLHSDGGEDRQQEEFVLV